LTTSKENAIESSFLRLNLFDALLLGEKCYHTGGGVQKVPKRMPQRPKMARPPPHPLQPANRSGADQKLAVFCVLGCARLLRSVICYTMGMQQQMCWLVELDIVCGTRRQKPRQSTPFGATSALMGSSRQMHKPNTSWNKVRNPAKDHPPYAEGTKLVQELHTALSWPLL
jgi:hypothetical protein